MLLLTSVFWLITAQTPAPSPCQVYDPCFNTGAPAHFEGVLRGDAASGYRVELEQTTRLLDAPFTASTQPRLLLEEASTAAKLEGQWVSADGMIDHDTKGLVLRQASVYHPSVFDYVNRPSEKSRLERLCTEPQRKHLSSWAATRAIPDVDAFAELTCTLLGATKPAAAGAPAPRARLPDQAERLAFPFSYMNCRKAKEPREFKTVKQLKARCDTPCTPSLLPKDYESLEFVRTAKGPWEASMSGFGDHQEDLHFIREEASGAWKLKGFALYLEKCD